MVNTVLEVNHWHSPLSFYLPCRSYHFPSVQTIALPSTILLLFVNLCCIYVVHPKLNEVASLLMDAVPLTSLGIVIDQIQNCLQYFASMLGAKEKLTSVERLIFNWVLFSLFPKCFQMEIKQHRKKQYSTCQD